VITIVLGIAVLHEPVTVLKIAGLTCIMAGVLILAHSPRPLCSTSRGQLSQYA
jgi:multidrug transporter EmrE-like cation transporter